MKDNITEFTAQFCTQIVPDDLKLVRTYRSNKPLLDMKPEHNLFNSGNSNHFLKTQWAYTTQDIISLKSAAFVLNV